MKKSKLKITALALCMGMLAGCAQKGSVQIEVERLETEGESDVNSALKENEKSTSDVNNALKMKYAGSESVEYTEPLYHLPRDYNFVFSDLSEAFMDEDEWECFKVFYKNSFDENSCVDISIEKDYDNNSVTIAPNLMFSYEVKDGKADDGTWGSRSKFYLVRYKDFETGEDLEKPAVTVFSLENEMNAPTVTQGVSADGYYALSWNAVEGADYYEIYYYDEGMDYSELEVTTENTSCNYSEFKTAKEHKKHQVETYGDTDAAGMERWGMNEFIESWQSYFVVAKTEDQKCSSMSNFCYVGDIANQIPVTVSYDFQSDYEGNDALALPAYADVEMVDGSIGQFVIQYHEAVVSLLDDGRIAVMAKMRNLPVAMPYMFLHGVDYEAFLADAENLKARENELAAKSVTVTNDINIPYVPESEPGIEPESELEQNPTGAGISSDLESTIFANSALSEWIAINLLNHKDTISLDGFNEASDSEYLMDALMEAYSQNPLIGILDRLNYNYATNSLEVTYVLSAEETEFMQTESLKKAAEIAAEITNDGMSDYEKEKAINQYLCEQSSYQDEILEYINEDGTISEDAVLEYANSFTPYGILCENKGVCESYAEAFLLIAKAAGMDAIIETGRMENVNHEWNRVNIDGNWYSLDVTNNDRDILPNCYFNLPDELAASVFIQSSDAMLDAFILNYTAEGLENEYYVKEGRYAEDADAAAQMLADGLEQGNISVIRTDVNLGQADIEALIEKAVEQSQLESGMYYYCSGVVSLIRE